MRYLALYPKTQVELMLTNRMVDLIAEGVDLAIRAGGPSTSNLVVKPFRETPACLWASRAYGNERGLPQAPEELAEHEFIRPQSLPPKLWLKSKTRRVEVTLRSRLAVDDLEASKAFVLRGAGIGLFPPLICEDEQAVGDLISVLSGWTVDFRPESQRLAFVYPPPAFRAPQGSSVHRARNAAGNPLTSFSGCATPNTSSAGSSDRAEVSFGGGLEERSCSICEMCCAASWRVCLKAPALRFVALTAPRIVR